MKKVVTLYSRKDGSPVNTDAFIIQVKTDNTGSGTTASNQFELPWIGTYDVDWGDGNVDTGVVDTQTHTYSSAGVYDISVTATTGRIMFYSKSDEIKLIDIKQWGTCQWTSMFDAFRGCINTVATFTDSPDLSNCTDLTRMFYDCQSIEMDIDNWDVSNIASISAMFINCRLFNSPLNSWDLSSIGSSLSSIFQGCYAFNQPIGNWGNYFVGKNINLFRVFRDCRSFNQDLTNWNQANQFVGSFYELFYNCNAFEGIGLETWNVRPNSMYYAFGLCYNFNADISGWDMSNVSDMQRTFVRASSFNQPIGSWDTSSVTKIGFMLERASSFDQDISSWSVNQITNFSNNFMLNVTLSTANYDALLIAWDAQGAMSYSGTVNFGNSQYTLGGAAEAARTSLISKWGGIIDGGGVLDTNTLIAYYNFNNNVLDQKNSYDGTWNGTSAYATGKSGQAISNNGNTSNYISIADADAFSFTNGTSDIPFSISFYHYSNSSSEQMLINKMGASNNREWYIDSFSNQIKVRLYNSDGGTTNFIGRDFSHTRNNNIWYHYVITYDGSETSSGIKMYIDGVLNTGSQSNGGTYTGMANLVQETVIGRFNDLTLLPLDGLIDGMGIWNKELSAGEVTQIYNTQNGGSEVI